MSPIDAAMLTLPSAIWGGTLVIVAGMYLVAGARTPVSSET